jgi:2,3-bisphosphoglycerate-independent phosphoglycerate mutase
LSKAALFILDGWGLGQIPSADAIAQANTPFVDSLMANYPHSTLITHSEAVGLPEGQMGNSEVGHLNIGAGRVVWQELARINRAVRERELHQHPVLLEAFEYARQKNTAVHFIGLVSDWGVHSHINHLLALCDMATEAGLQRTFVHAFTDGRDCDPKSGASFIQTLQDHIQNQPVQLATIVGRYYAMDRDKRWERVKIAYDLLVKGTGTPVTDPVKAITAHVGRSRPRQN